MSKLTVLFLEFVVLPLAIFASDTLVLIGSALNQVSGAIARVALYLVDNVVDRIISKILVLWD